MSATSDSDQRTVLASLQETAENGAVLLALHAEDPPAALAWLDTTCAASVALVAATRSAEFIALASTDADLAQRLRRATSTARPQDPTLPSAAKHRESTGEVLKQIRQLPGFGGFLRPRTTDQIIASLAGRPTAVIAVGTRASVAVVVNSSGVVESHSLGLTSDMLVAQLNRSIGGSLAARLGLRSIVEDHLLPVLARSDAPTTIVPVGFAAWLPIQSTCALAGIKVEIRMSLTESHPTTALGPALVAHSHGGPESPRLDAGHDEAVLTARLLGIEVDDDSSGVTPELVLDRLAASCFVHLSCHGGLAVVEGPKSDGSSDGAARAVAAFAIGDRYLSLRRLAERLELVDAPAFVGLSACDSGKTEIASPEQAVGFPTALLAAGTPTVLATHWPVYDAAARDLTLSFYRAWASGLSAGDAFSRAVHTVHAACIQPGGPPIASVESVYAFCLYGDTSRPWPGPRTFSDVDDHNVIDTMVLRDFEHTRSDPMTDEELADTLLELARISPDVAGGVIGPAVRAWLDDLDAGTADNTRRELLDIIGISEHRRAVGPSPSPTGAVEHSSDPEPVQAPVTRDQRRRLRERFGRHA